MTEPCCRAAAINARQHMHESGVLLKALVFASLVGMGAAWLLYLSGLINGDWLACCLSVGTCTVCSAPVGSFLLLLALCWTDARRWDKEHRS